jgi:CubicO group peptidase (beta-lactamase class C family)
VGLAAYVLFDDGRPVESRNAGTVVPWWSFTKTVLAATALALVRDGCLELDGPLGPEGYTLRHLLQHRSGLPDYGGLATYHEAVERGDPPWPAAVLLERSAGSRPRFPPGCGWDYSNIGYFQVTRLIETGAGQDLAAALSRLVLDPLAIEARLARRPADLVGVEMGEATGYHPGWVYHGLLVGPLEEAARLLHRLLAGSLLPASLLEQMRTAHVLGGRVAERPWKRPGYGLGLMSGLTQGGIEVEGHTGSGPGSVCAVFHDRRRAPSRVAAAFATTKDTATVERTVFDLLA